MSRRWRRGLADLAARDDSGRRELEEKIAAALREERPEAARSRPGPTP